MKFPWPKTSEKKKAEKQMAVEKPNLPDVEKQQGNTTLTINYSIWDVKIPTKIELNKLALSRIYDRVKRSTIVTKGNPNSPPFELVYPLISRNFITSTIMLNQNSFTMFIKKAQTNNPNVNFTGLLEIEFIRNKGTPTPTNLYVDDYKYKLSISDNKSTFVMNGVVTL